MTRYCEPSDVRLLIETTLEDGDMDKLIQQSDSDLDDLLGSYTMSSDLKKRCSSLLTAIAIADRQPKSYSVGTARISHGERVKRWRAKVDELVTRATQGRLKVKSSEYQKIDEDSRYPS